MRMVSDHCPGLEIGRGAVTKMIKKEKPKFIAHPEGPFSYCRGPNKTWVDLYTQENKQRSK